ncbi:hypothetical protein CC_1416 [Caulobacter vibrioides CB15]|uniref:Uncharacterized protein n=1 Tax=Caulobacter vibrioides (strain ATCC 19089 / CIP 103742 / CB 15) TaxID=190650 RepID=Q9A8D8_CAUVC|nr:hypothetical protein CC_1416 [Caulobacter vibrioides CB15]ATC28224.1 hypothetical protein CA607_07495 [Caulobacter vibrioides]
MLTSPDIHRVTQERGSHLRGAVFARSGDRRVRDQILVQAHVRLLRAVGKTNGAPWQSRKGGPSRRVARSAVGSRDHHPWRSPADPASGKARTVSSPQGATRSTPAECSR